MREIRSVTISIMRCSPKRHGIVPFFVRRCRLALHDRSRAVQSERFRAEKGDSWVDIRHYQPNSLSGAEGPRDMGNVLGLVMTGGGARGAYQAGVLQRIGEIKRVRARGNPFPIIGAASAGAINGTALAAGSDDFASTTALIAQLWSGLQPSDVFRCDIFSQAANSFAWILDLSFGGILGGGHAHSLLDATPLRHFLSSHLHCDRIDANIKQGHLYALAVSATNYTSGKSYLFIQGKKVTRCGAEAGE